MLNLSYTIKIIACKLLILFIRKGNLQTLRLLHLYRVPQYKGVSLQISLNFGSLHRAGVRDVHGSIDIVVT